MSLTTTTYTWNQNDGSQNRIESQASVSFGFNSNSGGSDGDRVQTPSWSTPRVAGAWAHMMLTLSRDAGITAAYLNGDTVYNRNYYGGIFYGNTTLSPGVFSLLIGNAIMMMSSATGSYTSFEGARATPQLLA